MLALLQGTAIAGGEPIDECGELYHLGACLTFISWTSGEEFIVPDTGEYGDDDVVRLRGTFERCDSTCHGFYIPYCVTDAVMEPCRPETLGCGVLSDPYFDGYCWLWTSPLHGSLLSGLPDGYGAGDTVGVIGVVKQACPNVCLIGDGCIEFETFYPCPDTITAVSNRGWGSIKAGFR